MNIIPKPLLAVGFVIAVGAAIYEGRVIGRQQVRLGELAAAAVKSDRREQQLRGERGQLLQKLSEASQAAEPAAAVATAPSAGAEANPASNPGARVAALVRSWMDRFPEKTSPELSLLSDFDIVAASNNSPLETEDQAIRVLISLRTAAQSKLAPLMIGALRRYLAANGDVLPSEPTQLAPYFSPPLDPAILPRYEMLQSGSVAGAGEAMLVGQRLGAMIEGPYDVQFLFSRNQVKVNTLTAAPIAFQHALERFTAANNGQKPVSAEQLQAYLTTPIEPAKLQELFDHPPGPASPTIMDPASMPQRTTGK